MEIKDNKDLEYTKIPGGTIGVGDELKMDIKKMLLISIDRENLNTLRLDLKTERNEKRSWIRAKNATGEQFLNLLEKELQENFIGRSYDEIINTDFKKLASRIPWTEN